MKINQEIAALVLRLALAAGFLSAVASRVGLWGRYSSGWLNFVVYVGQVNSFLPANWIPFIAVASTVLELSLGVFLLVGYKTSYAALFSAALTLLFSLAMTFSSGIKQPLDYSVFAFSAGALVLATMPHYKWSIDQLISQ